MSAIGSYSTVFESSIDSGVTYVVRAGIEDIVPPAKKKKAIKSSHLNSTNNYHTYFGGMKEGGECKLKIVFDKTEHAAWDVIFEATANYTYRVTLVDGSKIVFDAVVTDFSTPTTSTDDDNALMTEITLKVSGKPAFTAGA